MKLIIEDDEGRKTVVPLVRDEITIGRQEGNTIRLTERNVSRRHARLVKENGHVLIEDLGSYNGVRVNGEKITAPTRIKEGDLVEIGDYDLGIQGKLEASTATPASGTVRPLTIPPGGMKTLPPVRPSTFPPQSTAVAGALATATASAEKAAAGEKPPPTPSSTPNASAGGATAIIRVSDVLKAMPQGEARELERSEMPRLVGLAGPFRAKEFYLMRSEVKFGRTDENDIVADHQSVSRAHARFVLDDGHWKVIDNKSANGVRVNGEEYAVSNLKSGDVIELGHLKFRFCAPGEKFSPPAEKGDALFKQHKYLAAMDMYEKAGTSPAPNKKKADEEARGEEAYNSLRGAIALGDGDKARNLFERCGGEQTWWCQKAPELGDQVKAAYAKKHLEEATAAKSAGKLDRCLVEVNKVLG